MATPPASRLFEPIRVGRLTLKNRIIAPPHAANLGALFGTEPEADRYISYWRSLAEGGTGLLTALNGFVENILPPGFDPTGVGARKVGVFRNPLFVERMGRIAEAGHANGAAVSTQLIMQGGMPHGPSPRLSGPVINNMPHALTRREIRAFAAEYRLSAEQALRAGLDAIELHANHDDLIEWFLSPLTNHRSDAYGGSFERRMAFLGEIIAEIRAGVGDRLVIGVRLNMIEDEPGGYNVEEGLAIADWLQEAGRADYLHLVVGTGWGNPSYIQSSHYKEAQWAELAGRFKARARLPIAYAGRVNNPEVAEQIIASGLADMVGVGRAHLADSQWANKAASGRSAEITRCIACNECISRPLAEGLPLACTVNPRTGVQDPLVLPKAGAPKRLLVVGGGPAGMQLALTARERGHNVEIWERAGELGGRMNQVARLPDHANYLDFSRQMAARVASAGVIVQLNREATADSVRAHGADVVALATGARLRRPEIPGVDGPCVYDAEQILEGGVKLAGKIAVIAQDDHIAPLSLASHIANGGADVTIFIQTNGPAPQLSRYIVGGVLGRLSEQGVKLVCMEAVSRIALPVLHTRNIYSQRPAEYAGFDAVVLACGGVADASLYEQICEDIPNVHVLGDAYAPRRVVFATQQGHELGKVI